MQGATVLLAHSNRTIDVEMVGGSQFESVAISAEPLSTKPIGFLRFCLGFWRSSAEIRKLIQDRNIDCVLATGGFVAAPALHGANKVGCKTVLLNLDNPAGKANSLAVRWADRVLSTVDCDLHGAELIAPPLRMVAPPLWVSARHFGWLHCHIW